MSQDHNAQRRGAPGGWLLSLVGALAGGLAAIYVSAHFSAWAPLLLWLALAMGLLVAIAFFAHLVPGWLVGTTLAFTSSLIFLLYIVVAFNAQLATSLDLVQLLPLIGALGLSSIVLLTLGRRRGQLNVVSYDIASEASDGAPNPNRLERIMVYADESMLQRRALLMAACAGGLGATLRWVTVSHADSANYVLFGILLMFASVHLALAVARLFMSGPTLVIGPEGILDNASLVATGSGLLRWDEISRVAAVSEKAPIGITYHFLRIYLDNKTLVRARQPLWKRLLATVAGGLSPSWVTVYRGLLDESPETLAVQITQYARTYAVAGWRLPNPPDEPTGNSGDIWRM